MSFNWILQDKNGNDLLKEFGVHYKLLGIGPNNPEATNAPYRVSDFRYIVKESIWAWDHPPAAVATVSALQEMAQENIDSLKPWHCETCKCPEKTPNDWSKEACLNLIKIPLTRVHRARGGY